MILHIAVAVLVILLLYYWMNMKPMNFPPGKVHAIGKRKPRLMMNSSS
jgi:hypothetical protein